MGWWGWAGLVWMQERQLVARMCFPVFVRESKERGCRRHVSGNVHKSSANVDASSITTKRAAPPHPSPV
eukprot:243615-Chlamydomonas_euryale.AAC.1